MDTTVGAIGVCASSMYCVDIHFTFINTPKMIQDTQYYSSMIIQTSPKPPLVAAG